MTHKYVDSQGLKKLLSKILQKTAEVYEAAERFATREIAGNVRPGTSLTLGDEGEIDVDFTAVTMTEAEIDALWAEVTAEEIPV